MFREISGRILYIGKARDLRKRVQSHFKRGSNLFLSRFLEKISDIDWIKTENESQALLLENQLIKKYQPRYNIQWRDDKSYFWVTFSQDEWPRVEIVHKNILIDKTRNQKTKTKNCQLKTELIGPFVNGKELRITLRALRKIFPYRTCKNPYDKPCLQWHLGLCPAHKPFLLLSERGRRPSRRLNENPSTSAAFGSLRSGNKDTYLNSLFALSQFLRLYAGEPIRIEAYDISNIQGRHAAGSMIVFEGNKPKKSDYRRFRIKTITSANDAGMIKEIIKRRFNHQEWPYPDLILVDGGKAQLSAAKLITKNYKLKTALVALAKKQEEIYTEHSDRVLKINQLPEFLRLTFQHIRDKAHRFAIFYYRYLHAKRDIRKSRKTDRKTDKNSPKTQKA